MRFLHTFFGDSNENPDFWNLLEWPSYENIWYQPYLILGRTGHWLNHGKEHCLVGLKGTKKLNRGIDCDVIVAEVRATSHKPDEIYGIIERLSPGTRKIELL